MSRSSPSFTRRDALRTLAIGSAALAFPWRARAAQEDRRLRLAFFGVGGKGRGAVMSMTEHHMVAFADVDDVRAQEVFTTFPKVPRYRDYRKLLDKHADEIDGIVISTPDHLHLLHGLAAIDAGKHIYLEKPLAPTISECRELSAAASKSKVKTQMGVHGHSFEALRLLREWIDAGAAGKIHSVVLWSDRLKPHEAVWSETLAEPEPIPDTFDWDLWLGTRPKRPYSSRYAPNRWRNWWNYGAGPLGDIGVHMFDALTFALDLDWPDHVVAETPARSRFTSPPWTKAEWSFPSRNGKPAIKIQWIGGTKDGALIKPDDVPRVSKELVESTLNGMALVGTEGTLFIPDMRASVRPRIFPLEREREFLASPPPRRLERPKGGHYQDWVNAILDNKEASVPIPYGAELTEKVLLGTLAQRTGEPIRWSREKMKTLDNPEADKLVRPEGLGV